MIKQPSKRDVSASRTELLQASPPIFRSGSLDRLTRVHPAVPPLIFVPTILVLGAVALATTSPTAAALAFLAGWAFWTLCEYWTHRTVFHFEPERASARACTG